MKKTRARGPGREEDAVLTTKTRTAKGAYSREKNAIPRRGKTKPDKVFGVVMAAVGFGAALALGYKALPALLYETKEQPLQFNHAVHTGEKGGIACEDCHVFREDGSFSGVPATESCAQCHETAVGNSRAEKTLVDKYLKTGEEIPWLIYSRQPDNAFFPHAVHVNRAELQCAECHGPHGASTSLPVYQVNRISGYSRDIWGRNISGVSSQPWEGMKMDRCVRCHAERRRDDSCLDCHK